MREREGRMRREKIREMEGRKGGSEEFREKGRK